MNGSPEVPESTFLHPNVLLDLEATKCSSVFPGAGDERYWAPQPTKCWWERVGWGASLVGMWCNLSCGQWVIDCLAPFCYPMGESSTQPLSTLSLTIPSNYIKTLVLWHQGIAEESRLFLSAEGSFVLNTSVSLLLQVSLPTAFSKPY